MTIMPIFQALPSNQTLKKLTFKDWNLGAQGLVNTSDNRNSSMETWK